MLVCMVSIRPKQVFKKGAACKGCKWCSTPTPPAQPHLGVAVGTGSCDTVLWHLQGLSQGTGVPMVWPAVCQLPVPPARHAALGDPISCSWGRAVQALWEVPAAPKLLLRALFAQSHPSCGVGTNPCPPDPLVAKAPKPIGHKEFIWSWLEGED